MSTAAQSAQKLQEQNQYTSQITNIPEPEKAEQNQLNAKAYLELGKYKK
jgi:hypothetical protein